MVLAGVVLLSLLGQASPQSLASSATIRARGHSYQLYCLQEGEEIQASETGICQRTESEGLRHFEIRNEDGDAQFSKDMPPEKPFGYVSIASLPDTAGREILEVDTSQEETAGGGPKSAHVIYYFDMTASGLVPFNPPLVGIEGFAQLTSGMALSATFNAGFFQFSVLLQFNSATHRIEIAPDQVAFSAFPPPGRDTGGPSQASGEVELHNSHESGAPHTAYRIARGHLVAWWQSLKPAEESPSGQVVKILAAWAPVSLRPADNAPEGVQMVYYDWNNLWLQVEVDNHTGWVKGTRSFRALGLEMTNANH